MAGTREALLSRRRADGWIDVHAHFSPPRAAEDLQAGLKMVHAGCFMAPHPFAWSPQMALDHMDRCGIAIPPQADRRHNNSASLASQHSLVRLSGVTAAELEHIWRPRPSVRVTA